VLLLEELRVLAEYSGLRTRSSILDGEKDLEALSASKIAKVGDVYFL
jgi:hypothetical protein